MYWTKLKYVIIAVSISLIFSACNDANEVSNIIRSEMQEQEDCWNSGDIDCFMKHYWHSDSVMFIGKSGITYGWQKVLDNYKASYSSPSKMGNLTFDISKVERLDNSNYFVVGAWLLTRPEEGNLSGYYTLLWKNIDGHWVIVADHSS